ncbi:hypothetical protein [Azospirillum melinis]
MLQDLFSRQACIARYEILFATFHTVLYASRDSNSFGVQVSKIVARLQNCHFDGATREWRWQCGFDVREFRKLMATTAIPTELSDLIKIATDSNFAATTMAFHMTGITPG